MLRIIFPVNYGKYHIIISSLYICDLGRLGPLTLRSGQNLLPPCNLIRNTRIKLCYNY